MSLKAKIDMLVALIGDIETEYRNACPEQEKEFEKYVMPLDDMAREFRSAINRRKEGEVAC
ncbi:hypothetical protein [Anaerosolibacter sp.]|uniref:hypothetical protein n=1 Tax=Anaerosolibacter sp. TaxID=1872527 RepID=UPI0039EE0997